MRVGPGVRDGLVTVKRSAILVVSSVVARMERNIFVNVAQDDFRRWNMEVGLELRDRGTNGCFCVRVGRSLTAYNPALFGPKRRAREHDARRVSRSHGVLIL